MAPEARTRADIDCLLAAAGWHICNYRAASIHAALGVAIREVELAAGHGTANHLLYMAFTRLQHVLTLITQWGDFKLWPAQIQGTLELEAGLAPKKLRADPDGRHQRRDVHGNQLLLSVRVRRREACAVLDGRRHPAAASIIEIDDAHRRASVVKASQ